MRDEPWSRDAQLGLVRDQIWRWVSGAAQPSSAVLPLAAALGRLPRADAEVLAALHLLLAPQTERLLADASQLVRHLTTSATAPLDVHPERLRGPVDWAATTALQAVSGRRRVYATRPVERDYGTPQNRLLLGSLRVVCSAATTLGRLNGRTGVGVQLRQRATDAARLLASPVTRHVVGPPLGDDLRRVERGRSRHRYEPVTAFWRLQTQLHDLEDRRLLRRMVEQTALVPATDGVVMELRVLFEMLRVLSQWGWLPERPMGLVQDGVRLNLRRGSDRLRINQQRAVLAPSHYGAILGAHGMSQSALRPDLTLQFTSTDGRRHSTVVEVKYRPAVLTGVRSALLDCLSYLRTYMAVGHDVDAIGVAWGAGLRPVATHGVSLCTVDHLAEALSRYKFSI